MSVKFTDYINLDGIEIGMYRDGPVGASVSCGADSAIILYLLMREIKHDLHIYNVIGEYRRHVLEPAFDRVVETCKQLTGKTNVFVHKVHVPKPPVELIFNVFKAGLDSGDCDIIYTGMTKFPPDEVYADWEEKLPDWHVQLRKSDEVYPLFGMEIKIPPGTNCATPPLTVDGLYKPSLIQDPRVYNPMVNYDKRSIAKLYRALGVEKELFPNTRSCENDEHTNGHCGKCWWCNERIWGFGYLE